MIRITKLSTRLVSTFVLVVSGVLYVDWSLAVDGPVELATLASESGGAVNDHTTDDGAFMITGIDERSYENGFALAVLLSEAVDSDQDLGKFIEVYEGSEQKVEGEWWADKSGRRLYFPSIEPETLYTVVVQAGISSASGRRLEEPVRVEIETQAISPDVEFIHKSHYLPFKLSTGLTVSSINIHEVTIDFFRIRTGSEHDFLARSWHSSGSSRLYGGAVDEMASFGERVYSDHFSFEQTRNKRHEHLINLRKVRPLRQPGLYLAVMTPRGKYGSEYLSATYFSVADFAMHARRYKNSVDVYVSSIKTSEPIADVEVILHDYGDWKIIGTARSDVDGRVSFDITADNLVLFTSAAHGNSRAYLFEGDNLLQSSVPRPLQYSEELFIHSPRDLYRPGEIVEFGLLRRDSDGRIQAPTALSGTLLSSDYTAVKKFVLEADEMGYYRHRLELTTEVKPGEWFIEVRGAQGGIAEYWFQVEDFLPERMDIKFTGTAEQNLIADSSRNVIIPVRGRYLHGFAASGNRVSAIVSARPAAEPVKKLRGFIFGDLAGNEAPETVTLDNIVLDAAGKGALTVPASWFENQMPLEVDLTAILYEKSGRALSRDYTFTSWPGGAQIGIRSRCECDLIPQNSTAEFEIVKAHSDGTLMEANGVLVRLIKEEHHRRQHYDGFEDPENYDRIIDQQKIDLNSNTPALVRVYVERGEYRLEITDPSDASLIGSLHFYAGSRVYDQHNATGADKVEVVLDKPSYRLGDIARVKIVPPHAGQAIVLVESNQRLWYRRLRIPSEGAEVEIPIDPQWRRHDLYISATVFSTGGKKGHTTTPKRAMGLVHLPLDSTDRRLDVQLIDIKKLESNKSQEIEIMVDNAHQSASDPIYVTVAVADAGALKLTEFESPDPFEFFFKQRDYTSKAFDSYSLREKTRRASRYKSRVNRTVPNNLIGLNLARLSVSSPASTAVRRMAQADARILSILTEPVRVDADGRARVTLNIPSINGRVRLTAMAYSRDRIGSSELEVPVTAPVVIQASLPRFMAFGDSAQASVAIFNTTQQKQTYKVRVRVQGAVRLTQKTGTKTVELTKGDLALITLPLKALRQTGKGSIVIAVTGQDMRTVTERRSIEVRPAWPAVMVSAGKHLAIGQQLLIDESLGLNKLESSTVDVVVTVSDRPNLRLGEQVLALLRYPYGCLEQTTSAAFALVYPEPDRLKQISGLSEDAINRKMENVQNRLEAMRRSQGGFGLWHSKSTEDRWLTVHAAELLLRAQAQGFSVQPPLLEYAVSQLQHYLKLFDGRLLNFTLTANDGPNYDFAVRAYAAYVLSTVNKVELTTLHILHKKYLSPSKPAKPSAADSTGANANLPTLHLALALKNQGDTALAEQLIDKALAEPLLDYSDFRGDYGSALRDGALIVHLLLENNLHTLSALVRARDIMNRLNGIGYISTQEHRALLAAAVSLNKLEKSAWQIALDSHGKKKFLSGQGSRSYVFSREQISSPAALLAVKGKNIYASVSTTGYPRRAPRTVSDGLKISRKFFSPQDSAVDISQIKSSDLVGVELVIDSTTDIRNALVVDLLPAGFEFDNSLSSTRLGARVISAHQRQRNTYAHGYLTDLQHTEFRDDRLIASLSFKKDQTFVLTYYVRAVTPGTYTVPPPLAEDMYNPERRAVGESSGRIVIGSIAE
ncbi:MAG: alpha-2-macroglobulin family protein [Gammaproteobacteria bacterium]|nr:alpha-2-macroglobulin family protein [Gammaproteobacteria bacterium]